MEQPEETSKSRRVYLIWLSVLVMILNLWLADKVANLFGGVWSEAVFEVLAGVL